MNAGRIAVWVVGLFLVLVGVWYAWDAAGLDQYISRLALVAAILLIAGIAAMAFATSNSWGHRRVERTERVGYDYERRPARGETVEERRVVEDDEGRSPL